MKLAANGMALRLPSWLMWILAAAFVAGMAMVVTHILDARSQRSVKQAEKKAAKDAKKAKAASKKLA